MLIEKTPFLSSIYFTEIIERLKKQDWFIHNFCTENVYNYKDYWDMQDESNVSFKLVLDLNIFQFIINAYKKEHVNEVHKDAIALIIFCIVTDINIEPGLAIHEKLGHQNIKLNEVIEDLKIFDQINDSPIEELVSFMFNKAHVWSFGQGLGPKNYLGIKQKFENRQELRERKSLHLITLILIEIHFNDKISHIQKLSMFIDTSLTHFRKSAVCIIFASMLWGKQSLSKMIKYQQNQSMDKKRNAIDNMVWDFYLMNRYIRMWENLQENEVFMFASNDKVLKRVLRLTIKTLEEGLSCLEPHLRKEELLYVGSKIESTKQNDRIYGTDKFTPEYREKLIKEYETKLLG